MVNGSRQRNDREKEGVRVFEEFAVEVSENLE